MTGLLDYLHLHKVLLPPLCGFTDLPFRRILSECGAGVISTEMVNARAIIQRNSNTYKMLDRVNRSEVIEGVQLVGHDPSVMTRAAGMVEDLGFEYIDINMGCTVRKVINKGEGVALMKEERVAVEIASEVIDAVSVPVTIKMRSGFSAREKNATSLASSLSEVGVSLLTIHGRCGENKFAGPIDEALIRSIVSAVKIPVVANGGMHSCKDAKAMLEATGASAVMPGRSLMGDPWLPVRWESALSGEESSPPSFDQRKEVCKRHIGYALEFFGERRGITRMRKVVGRYFPCCTNGVSFREKLNSTTSEKDILSLVDSVISDGQGGWLFSP